MTEAQIKSVALFFFYVFADKATAFAASTEALHLFEKKIKNLTPNDNVQSFLVFSTYKIWKRYLKRKNKISEVNPVTEQGWIVPAPLKLEQWWQFSKDSEPIIVLTLIWSILLEIDEKDIAEGLGVSEGTVRYRTGKALKLLGSIQGLSLGTST